LDTPARRTEVVDELTRNLKTGTRTFRIYTKDEADELKIPYKPWREVGVGDWALSDDGYVAECYVRKDYEGHLGKVNTFLRLAFGAYWTTAESKCVYMERKVTGDYSSTRPQPWGEREARRPIVKQIVKMYVAMWLRGKGIDWKKLGLMYRKDQKLPDATARRLFRQPEIREMVNKELKKIFTENGVDEKYVLELYKGVVDKAVEKEQLQTILRVADTLADMLHMTSESQAQQLPTGGLLAGMVVDDQTARLMEAEDKKLAELRAGEVKRKKEEWDEGIQDAEYSEAPRATEE
jgi:hypothetical protein